MKRFISVIIFTLLLITNVQAQTQTEDLAGLNKLPNQVYGMVSGLALLMDVYSPAESNGKGILVIGGSGWREFSHGYDEYPLKQGYPYLNKAIKELYQRGYVIFTINVRNTPGFRYPAAIEDSQRAVKYIRYHAKKYHIDPDKLGAIGHSSGGYLAAFLGLTLPEESLSPEVNTGIGSKIESQSHRVQAVVTLAAPFDIQSIDSKEAMGFVVDFMGDMPGFDFKTMTLTSSPLYDKASPINHVTKNSAPMMIFFAQDDPIIPAGQGKAMMKKLSGYDVYAKVVPQQEGGHNPEYDVDLIDKFFQQQLK